MIGLKVLKRRRAVPVELALQFIDVPVSNVSDCMSRLFAGGARLRPMHRGLPMSGPALTVRTRPGDNLMIHKALQMAAPGDIIVVDAGGDLTNAVIGDLLVGIAIQRGLGGFVINGAIRDALDSRPSGSDRGHSWSKSAGTGCIECERINAQQPSRRAARCA